jgi:WD40 repeat protein
MSFIFMLILPFVHCAASKLADALSHSVVRVCLDCLPGKDTESPPITAVVLDSQEKELVVGSQGGVEVFRWPDLTWLRRIPTKLTNIHDIAFAPDHKSVVLAGGQPGASGSLEILDWPSGKRIERITPHKDVVYSVAWHPSGKRIATASADGTAKIIEAPNGKTILALEGHSRPVTSATWSPSQVELITGSVDESVRVWNADTGAPVRNLSNHTRPVLGLANRPGNHAPPQLASIGADKTVRLWQPTIGRMMRFAKLASEPRAIGWTHDGAWIVVASVDGRVRIIDPETIAVKHELPALDTVAHCLAVTKDGHIVVGGANGQLKSVKLP